ncbi:Protein spire 2 [Saguinus oedipus]|uniref:Protein spire 2 n=1 Tax=Saguinus oedipus TaxID=9490 RepID=A0ABQ9TLY1_SAGOE|nr:Protein spire 2 [Saguinus oedipus]
MAASLDFLGNSSSPTTQPRGHGATWCHTVLGSSLSLLRRRHQGSLTGHQMLQKLREDEPQVETPQAELDSLGHTDWARLWVQLMRELRHGVKLKKVQEQEFNPLPTEFQLTPFEMLMQDIRARNYKLRKVMVSGLGVGAAWCVGSW